MFVFNIAKIKLILAYLILIYDANEYYLSFILIEFVHLSLFQIVIQKHHLNI